MARTRSPDYENIRGAILNKTAALFAGRGFAASSITDIAEACDCSKSRLYHYFESKESILATMLQEHVDKLLAGAYAILDKHPDPVARFRAIVRFFMEVYAFSGDKHVVMLTCISFLPDDVRKDVIGKQRELVSFVHAILKEIAPPQSGGRNAIYVDSMLFFGMINWTYTWYSPDGPISPDQLADRALRIFLDGYRRVDDQPPARAANARQTGKRTPAHSAKRG